MRANSSTSSLYIDEKNQTQPSMVCSEGVANIPDTSRLRSLSRSMSNAGVCILYQSADMKYLWSENLPAIWENIWFKGCVDTDLMTESAFTKLAAVKDEAINSGIAKMLELNISTGNTSRWYEFYIDCDYSDDGSLSGMLTTMVDISELKRREQILKALLREVSHRSKNLLSIIQSVAAQTARFTDTIDGFLHKFRGRIQSLSHSQDLVTESNWHGALFRDLVRSQLGKYADTQDPRLKITGENPYLFPSAALHLGLALHELAVNATSFGGLSPESQNHIVISMEVEENADGTQQLVFVWHETDLDQTPIDENALPRFGSAVLQRIIPSVVEGEAEYKKTENGVIYRLTIAKNHFDL